MASGRAGHLPAKARADGRSRVIPLPQLPALANRKDPVLVEAITTISTLGQAAGDVSKAVKAAALPLPVSPLSGGTGYAGTWGTGVIPAGAFSGGALSPTGLQYASAQGLTIPGGGGVGVLKLGTSGQFQMKDDGTLLASWNAGNFKINSQNSTERFNPRAYGAALDGSTDDTAAFNAALTAAGAVKGTIYIPPSAGLRFTTGVTIPPGVSIVGDGVNGGSRLIADLTGVAITINAGSNVSPANAYTRIEDIDLRHGTATPTTLIWSDHQWFLYI